MQTTSLLSLSLIHQDEEERAKETVILSFGNIISESLVLWEKSILLCSLLARNRKIH